MLRRFLMLILLLTGCTAHRAKTLEPETRAEYEQVVRAFIGRDINELYAALGVPRTRSPMPNGDILYEWTLAPLTRFGTCLSRFTADQLGTIRTAFLVGDGCGSE